MRKARDHKLTVADEQHILRLLDEGFHVNVVAERFAVGESTIHRIKNKYQPPSAPAPSSKVKIRRRKISPLRRQFLWHLWDLRAKQATSLEKLARRFETSVEEIQEAIASRKKVCPVPYGHWQTESESENDG